MEQLLVGTINMSVDGSYYAWQYSNMSSSPVAQVDALILTTLFRYEPSNMLRKNNHCTASLLSQRRTNLPS